MSVGVIGRILDMSLWNTALGRSARANQLVTVVMAWVGIAAGAAFLFLFNPSSPSNQFFFPVCPFRAITGFVCPGCGSTRGLHSLVHGDIVGAFEFNPLLILSLPFLLFALVRYTTAAVTGRPPKVNRLDAKYIWMVFVVIMCFWVFRNTRYYPFPL